MTGTKKNGTKVGCPVPGCSEMHARRLMMCPTHWRQVPKPIRDEVWRSYREEGVLSEAYIEARVAAIESVTP